MLRLVPFIILMIVFAGGCAKDAPDAAANLSDAPAAERRGDAININTATAEELRRLPHIGPKKAAAIIEFRERRGGFRRAEELLLVDGISDARFRALRPLVTVE